MSTGTKFGGATTGAWYLVRTILEASGKQRIPARLFPVLDAIGATCHVMSKWPLELLLSGSFHLNFQSLLFTDEMVLMDVHLLLYCWLNFKSALSLSKYMSLL